jgi:transcriptional regulator with XRE-family HTH domain
MMDANRNGDSQIPDIEDQLKQAIAHCGLSQRRLAVLAGVHQPQIVWFMQGKKSLSLWAADRLAAALGLEPAPVRDDAGPEAGLRQRIADSGMSYHQLSRLTGVDNSQASRFARGERTLILRSAAKIATALRLQLRPASRGRRDIPRRS